MKVKKLIKFYDGHWIQGMGAKNHHENLQPPWNLADTNSSGGDFNARFDGDNEMFDKLKLSAFGCISKTKVLIAGIFKESSLKKNLIIFDSKIIMEYIDEKSNFSQTTKLIVLAVGAMAISLPAMAEGGGMTWGYRGQTIPNGPTNLVNVGCNSGTQWAPGQTMCNPYKGETNCSEQRHVLCMEVAGNISRPAYSVNPGKEQANGWSPRRIKLGPMIKGNQLTNIAVANRYCGNGWRIAEFHDGHWIRGMNARSHHKASNPAWNLSRANRSGGWNFHAQFVGNNNQLNKLKTERFWVNIRNQKANCWNNQTTTPPRVPEAIMKTCPVNNRYFASVVPNHPDSTKYYYWTKPYGEPNNTSTEISYERYRRDCLDLQ